MNRYFAVCAPGLEPFTAEELRGLGLLPTDSSLVIGPPSPAGGIEFTGDLSCLYAANLHLRTASRVLARLGMPFLARDFPELEQKAARLPWERFLAPGQAISLRVACHKSKLYHSDAVARSVARALAERLGSESPVVRAADEEASDPPQLVLVRLDRDECTVSVDSSGGLLHRRGYRLAAAKAPLRETLAAAMLLASGWDRTSPLVDPFCGSGTIPIEAAMMALGIPPGIHRDFAFMKWPGFDEKAWNETSNQRSAINEIPPILASDRDAGAIQMATANAVRAGVAEHIRFARRAVSDLQSPAGPGWVVTNPPYGVRVRQGRDLRDLYARFGDVLRRECPGWRAAILCSDSRLLGQMHLDLDTSFGLVNGGIKVRLARGTVPEWPFPIKDDDTTGKASAPACAMKP